MLSSLSVLSTVTSIASPSSDHACIHKYRSEMKYRKSSLVVDAFQVSWDEIIHSVWVGGRWGLPTPSAMLWIFFFF